MVQSNDEAVLNKSASASSSSASASSPSASSASASSPSPTTASSTSSSSSSYTYVPPSWFRCVIYDLFLWLFNITFDCFFRETRPRGAFKLPKSGPLIFVGAPHANQFVDPIILMNQVKKESGRRISFLIAMKSYKQKIIGWLAKCQLAIPVERPQDNLKPGIGKIFVDFDQDASLVKGEGTNFTKQLTRKSLVALPQSLGASEVVDVISDTELTIKKPFNQTDKIVSLLNKGTNFKVADKVDQKKVFQLVFNHLSHGNCVGIFPEGGSHDRTDLLPLKAGVAIMALGAMENDPDCNVKIIPCGMNYFNAHKFRSRAVIEFGHPIEIPKDLVKKYSNPESNREAIKDLLDIVTDGLKAVTVTCESYETLMVVQAARRLYAKNFAHHLPLPLIIEMNRRLVLGYKTFSHEPKIQELKSKILIYNEKLRQLYLPDHHVETFNEKSNQLRNLSVLIFRITKLFFFLSLALPGAILFSPVFIMAKLISNNKQRLALKNSMVKIKGNDVVATWKILISLVFAPIFYIIYASIGTFLIYEYELSQMNLFATWCLLYCFNVLITYSALITGEQGMDIFKSIRPLILSLTDGSSIKQLKNYRNELSEEITEVINEFGSQLFPKDFNLLDMKNSLKIDGSVNYVDSDEEEEKKTEELRHRRMLGKRRKRVEKALNENKQIPTGSTSNSNSNSYTSLNTELSLDNSKTSDSMSDGLSSMNSERSYTNIPMFSDYQLHKNAKRIDMESSRSSTDDQASDSDSQSSSHIELNFSGDKKEPKESLSNKIRSRVMQNRDKID